MANLVGRFRSVRPRAIALSAQSTLAVDTSIAVLCYLAMVAPPAKAAGVSWSLFVLAAVASLPLVWRRQQPVTVSALVGAGTIGLCATGAQNAILLPYGQLVATYTIASLASPLWRLLVMLGTTAGVVVAVVTLLRTGPATLATAGMAFVIAYALGTGARARRDHIAMLEERTARLTEEREAAAVRERERIAREIHDIVAHSVSLMVVQAESGAVLAADAAKATTTFDTIAAAGREAITHLDRALGVLRGDDPTRQPPPGLSDLPTLIQQTRQAGLDADLTVHGTQRPHSADFALTAYRLVQEALTNTLRHANARQVIVRLDWLDDSVRVQVSDDGRGLHADSPVWGRGLIGMRERVRAFGGVLDIGPGEGGIGVQVSASLPLPSATGTESADG